MVLQNSIRRPEAHLQPGPDSKDACVLPRYTASVAIANTQGTYKPKRKSRSHCTRQLHNHAVCVRPYDQIAQTHSLTTDWSAITPFQTTTTNLHLHFSPIHSTTNRSTPLYNIHPSHSVNLVAPFPHLYNSHPPHTHSSARSTVASTLFNMYTLSLALLATTALAYPGEVLKTRALTAKDYNDAGCPHYLPKDQFVSPSYITHISKKNPDKSYGPQHNGLFTPDDMASIFSFDIPASRADANCTLEFLFPKANQLKNSGFKYEGGGSFFFTGFNPGACPDVHTTYNNPPAPGPFPAFPAIHMEPGNAYTIDVGPCFVAAGTCAAGMTYTNDTTFDYFQVSNYQHMSKPKEDKRANVTDAELWRLPHRHLHRVQLRPPPRRDALAVRVSSTKCVTVVVVVVTMGAGTQSMKRP